MVRESLAMEVVQSVQLFIDSAAEPWNMLEEVDIHFLYYLFDILFILSVLFREIYAD
jgi:hypothetical protein